MFFFRRAFYIFAESEMGSHVIMTTFVKNESKFFDRQIVALVNAIHCRSSVLWNEASKLNILDK